MNILIAALALLGILWSPARHAPRHDPYPKDVWHDHGVKNPPHHGH